MSIGIVVLGSRPGMSGGLDVFVRNFVEAIAEFGSKHQFSVLVVEQDLPVWQFREWPAHIKFKGIKTRNQIGLFRRSLNYIYTKLGIPTKSISGTVWLANQIDELQLDLLHFPATVIHPICVKTPCVLTFFDIQQEYFPEFFTAEELLTRARVYKASVEKAKLLICPTQFTAQTLEDKFRVDPRKMHIVPVGLSTSFKRPDKDEINRVMVKYDLPDRFIYYPANPWIHKNHSRLMAAMRIHKETHGEVPVLVLSGRLLNETRDAMSLAIAAGVEAHVIDLGFVGLEDLPSLYSAATALVFPSLFEGFGIPLLEAMAYGCPIAAANATTIPEVTNGAALLFDADDPVDIANAIYRLLHEDSLRNSMVEKGYEQLSRFDSEKVIREVIGVYGRAL